MSGDEPFLARWSRRKRDAAAAVRLRQPAPPSDGDGTKPVLPGEAEPAAAPPLPPIDSIGPASDVTAFLAPGVPLELTRAALRRAWTADPAIRDFVGLSENAWDFTAPDGVPGFGSIDADQVVQLVDELFAAPASAPDTPKEQIATPEGVGLARPDIDAPQHKNNDKSTAESGIAAVAAARCQNDRRHSLRLLTASDLRH